MPPAMIILRRLVSIAGLIGLAGAARATADLPGRDGVIFVTSFLSIKRMRTQSAWW
jgi:hypothetical protein